MEKKAALYIRVSTDAQAEEGYSIPAQSEKLTAYCKVRDLQEYELYIDGGFTGSNLSRPEIQRLIKDCNAQKISHVIVYKLDRLSRSQKDTLYLIEDVFIPNEVSFVSINENIDTSSPYGRAMIGILSAFAQLERENIFQRTRMGMQERVKQGYWMGGGRIPFGYDYDKTLGIIVPNADAPKVRAMYDLYLKGYSPRKIAAMLGLKYDKLVTQVLTRKSNTGCIVFRGTEYKGLHAPLVSEEVYQKAMLLMKQRERVHTASAGNLLSGLCYCGYCGARMRYQKWGNAGYRLVCYSKDKSKPHMVRDPSCPSIPLEVKVIEHSVLRDVFNLATKVSEPDNTALIQQELLSTRKKELKSQLKALYELYSEGNDVLLETVREKEYALKELDAELSSATQNSLTAKQYADALERIISVGEIWDELDGQEKRNIIQSIVERIVLTKDQLKIYYNLTQDVSVPAAGNLT